MNLLTNLGATNTRKVAKAIGSQLLFSTKLHHTIHKFIVPVPITLVIASGILSSYEIRDIGNRSLHSIAYCE